MSTFPSELRISKKWDNFVENLIVFSLTGASVAGLASIVLFRKGSKRLAFTGVGLGFGVGRAYQIASLEFEKEKSS